MPVQCLVYWEKDWVVAKSRGISTLSRNNILHQDMDHGTHQQHGGGHDHAMMMTPELAAVTDDAASSQAFCHGSGMIMYMDGRQ